MCQINLIYQKSGEQMHKENPQRSYDDYGAKYQKTAAPELERLLLGLSSAVGCGRWPPKPICGVSRGPQVLWNVHSSHSVGLRVI